MHSSQTTLTCRSMYVHVFILVPCYGFWGLCLVKVYNFEGEAGILPLNRVKSQVLIYVSESVFLLVSRFLVPLAAGLIG